MLKNLTKFIGYGLLLVVVGAGLLYGVQYWKERTSPEYQATEYFKDLEKQYAEDPYGGSTPEETLQLFIDALKKGDTDLAAKYFLIEDQEQWREDLAVLKEKGLLDEMVNDLEMLKLTTRKDGQVFYTLADENKIVRVEMIIDKGPSGKWKITEL